jgi:hypothetical protein
MIFKPVKTEDVSSVAAPWALRVVEGDDVEMGRFWEVCVDVCLAVDVCFEDDAGVTAGFAGYFDASGSSGCCVCMRVLTTSKGVVITPAAPPALAAVAISNRIPMLFDSM